MPNYSFKIIINSKEKLEKCLEFFGTWNQVIYNLFNVYEEREIKAVVRENEMPSYQLQRDIDFLYKQLFGWR